MSIHYRRAMITRVFGVPCGLLSIFIFLVLPIISSVTDPLPANEDNQSICRDYHRVTVIKDVSYTETYQERNRWGESYPATRTNYKSQEFTEWKMIEMCCRGYEPEEENMSAENCIPVCPSNCPNGTCHRPNECECDSGYLVSISKSTGFSECQPNCTSGCHGGICIEPETCICDIGYIPTEDQRSCKPICRGVIHSSGFKDCGENAACVEPDTCKCDNGYAVFTNETWSWFGKPTLRTTFNSSEPVICKPLCEPECEENAHCIAPNKCQCTDGYTAASSSNETVQCLPVCQPKCVNSFCSTPNVCTCHEGYKPHDLAGNHFCEPICQDECINAKCTLPNHCECAVGYEKLIIPAKMKQIVSENVCAPVCPGNCANGRCIAPGQCHCNQGYVFKTLGNQTDYDFEHTEEKTISIQIKSQGSCQPNCEPNCPNDYSCVAPNQCQIRYDNDEILHRFPIFRTRIVNDTDDCGIGRLFTKNDRGVCSYQSNGTNCYESNVCAVIIVDQREMMNYFMALRSIIFAINGTNEFVANGENNQTLKCQTSRCTKECRIVVTFGGSSKILHEDEIVDCYELKSRNETTGVLLLPITSPSLNHHHGIRRLGGPWIRYPALCFLKNDLPSNTTKSMKTENVMESNVHVVVIGIIGTIVIIVGIGVLLYVGRQKLSRLRHFRGVSVSNDAMMDGSMSRFSTGEN